jgi:phytoene synthase
MIAPADLDHCRNAIRTGSLSFHAASRLLPARVRDPAFALYAFCRLADDAVDDHPDKARAVLTLRDRLDLVYAGRPRNAPADRAFAAIVADFDMPRALPEALLEGLAWDAAGRRYDTLSGVLSYGARVAAAVGAMMCVLMRVRDADALARACDLGLAMQLTNIARDVGEDARAGRLYLPIQWFYEAGFDPDAFLSDPAPTPSVRAMVRRLLREADRLYARSEAGIAALPLDSRPGIFAARFVYAAIGGATARNDHDSVTLRARTGRSQKLALLALAGLRAGASALLPRPATLFARPEPEVAFLVDAAARQSAAHGRGEALLRLLQQLEAQDRARLAARNRAPNGSLRLEGNRQPG